MQCAQTAAYPCLPHLAPPKDGSMAPVVLVGRRAGGLAPIGDGRAASVTSP
ncbi:periplasmic metal ion binding protein [Ralstonia solanacearum]|nr:periplasmic metal ion binding protein [Ralstonia solanacearum]